MRRWNWVLQSPESIDNYLQDLKPEMYQLKCLSTVGNVKAKFITDSPDLLRKIQQRFPARIATVKRISRITQGEGIQLIYLARSKALHHACINTSDSILRFQRSRTDVAFDPLTRTLLMHGPEDSGYVKSLSFGILSHEQVEKGKYGLHVSVVTRSSYGIAFVGRHGAGKSTHALLALLWRRGGRIITDDWALFHRGTKGDDLPIAEAVERHLFINEATIQAVVTALSESRGSGRLIDMFNKLKLEKGDIDSRLTVNLEEILGKDKSDNNKGVGIFFCLMPQSRGGLRRIGKADFVKHLMTSSYHIPFHTSGSEAKLKQTLCSRKYGELHGAANYALDVLNMERSFWGDVYDKCETYAVGMKGNGVKNLHAAMEGR